MLFASSDWTLIGGLAASMMVNIVTVINSLRKNRVEVRKDDVDIDIVSAKSKQELQEQHEAHTVSAWRGYVDEIKKQHLSDMTSIRNDLSEMKKELHESRMAERACSEKAARQEEQIKNNEECIADLTLELKELKSALTNRGIRTDTKELQALPPGVYEDRRSSEAKKNYRGPERRKD